MALSRRIRPYYQLLSSWRSASLKQRNVALSQTETPYKVDALHHQCCARGQTTVRHRVYPVLLLVSLFSLLFLVGVYGYFGASTARLHRRPKRRANTTLHLIGERHSGTNWITKHLEKCFDHKIAVATRYTNFKHWFQTTEQRKNEKAVVVAMFRNPFHWTEAMRRKPYHSPLHRKLNWTEFVSKPWTMPRYDQDLQFENVTQETAPKIQCKRQQSSANLRYLSYQPYQVIPCHANARFPVINKNNVGKGWMEVLYELRNDGSGLPYENILELRRAKIQNFVGLQNFVRAFHIVRYEDMVRQGTDALIRKLEQELGIRAKCTPVVSRPSWTDRTLSMDYVEHIIQHVDWKTEALIGYSPAFLDELSKSP